MENLEQQFNKETDNEFLVKEFEKYKKGEISFSDLFAELEEHRVKVLKGESNVSLEEIDVIGEEMQNEEIKRVEGRIA